MRTTRLALAGATLWSLALLVGALTVPVYSGDSETADPAGAISSTSTSATLVGANGWWGLAVGLVPLVASLAVAGLLLGARGSGARVVALVIVGLLGIATVLSLLSVGLFVAPAVAALGVAVVLALSDPTGAGVAR